MANHNINVIGILIGAEDKDYKLYQMQERAQTNACITMSGAGVTQKYGLKNIITNLSDLLTTDTQFIIICDESFPDMEARVNTMLEEIKKIYDTPNDLLPILSSVTNDEPQDNQLKNIVKKQFDAIKTELNKAEELEKTEESENFLAIEGPKVEETQSSSVANISMMVVGGFIAAVGIAAVAVAFAALNVLTLGVAGLVTVAIGAAATLAGVGLFAAGVHRNRQTSSGEIDLVQDGSSFSN